jgi:hypothetical protein
MLHWSGVPGNGTARSAAIIAMAIIAVPVIAMAVIAASIIPGPIPIITVPAVWIHTSISVGIRILIWVVVLDMLDWPSSSISGMIALTNGGHTAGRHG